MSRHEVGEAAGVRHALEHLLHDLFGKAGLLAQLAGALARFAVQTHERRVLRVEGWQLGSLADIRLEVAARVAVVSGGRPNIAVQRQLDAPEAPLNLADAGDCTELV